MSDLCSAIQLLATLTIGFAILGYSEFFYNILKTKFFHAEETISKACEECQCLIPDKTSRDLLEPTKIGDGTTAPRIEQLKIDCEKVLKRIDEFKENSKNTLKEKCNTRSLASMCLFVFMVSVMLLFAPMAKQLFDEFVVIFLLPFSTLGIIYIIVGWCCGEKSGNRAVTRFESLYHPIICMLVILLLSVVFATVFFIWFNIDFLNIWKYTVVIVIILGWLNFVIYALFIRRAIMQFRKAVEREKDSIIEDCNRVKESYRALLTVADEAKRANGFASK